MKKRMSVPEKFRSYIKNQKQKFPAKIPALEITAAAPRGLGEGQKVSNSNFPGAERRNLFLIDPTNIIMYDK